MTKKRKITSSLFGEPKPQFVRTVLAATFGIIVAVGFAGVAEATEVWPTGEFDEDRGNVQNAVDQGGTVTLHATNKDGVPTAFNFEYVWIEQDVTIKGEKLSSSVYFNTPDGPILSDRAVVYCSQPWGG